MTKSYLLKIRGGVEVDSQGKKAGKGPLISEEVSATLGVSQDQYLFQPITFEPGIAAREGGHIYEGVSGTLRSNAGDNQMHVAYKVINLNKDDVQSKQILDPKGIAPSIYAGESRGGGGEMYVIENHPADSRVSLDDSGKVQTLTGRMGTGGGNTPMILEPIVYGISSYSSNSMKSDNPDSGIYEAKTSRSLDRNGGNPACNQGGMIVLEGNGSRPSHHGDGYLESDKMYTLNTIERHGVCYTVDQGGGKSQVNINEDMSPTLTATHDGAPAVCYATCHGTHHTHAIKDCSPTLMSSDYKDPIIVAYPEVVGTLMANSHPGSYCGQDAYNDMFIVEQINETQDD